MRVMFETGLRAGEVTGLEVADVDLPNGLLTVRRGKGGKGRVASIGPDASLALDRYLRLRRGHRLAGSADLWLGDRGKRSTYDALHKTLRERADAAGLVGFHPHKLRHTAAHRWLSQGGSESGLMAVASWDLERIHARTKAADKELRELVAATCTTLLDLHGIGPQGAARLLVEVGDITRFPNRNHFASWTGTAPMDASSDDHVRHRPSRGGNRQINQESGREDLEGSDAQPQTQAVRHRLPNHARGPGLARGTQRRVREGNGIATLTPARPAHNPNTGTSDKPLRDPSPTSLNPPSPRCLDTEGRACRSWKAARETGTWIGRYGAPR